MATTLSKQARTALTAHIESLGCLIAHSRRHRDGEIRFYLAMFTGDETNGTVDEVRWSPRTTARIDFYRHVWIETGHGNSGGHQEDRFIRWEELPGDLFAGIMTWNI